MSTDERMLRLREEVIRMGAFRAEWLPASELPTDPVFRDMCASNACGMYGKCWMCPPEVGDIHALIASLADYSHVLVYQTVGELEDSYDVENMMLAGEQHNALAQAIRELFRREAFPSALHLGAGGCRVCKICAKCEDLPCRFPHLAMPSLEAYGVNVSQLAKKADMRSVNGQNTVTYFGAVLI